MRYQAYGFTLSSLVHGTGIFLLVTFCKFMPLDSPPLLVDLTTFTVQKTAPKAVPPARPAISKPLPVQPLREEKKPVAAIQPATRKKVPIITKQETPAEIVEITPTPLESPPAIEEVVEQAASAAIVPAPAVTPDAQSDAITESIPWRRQEYIRAHFLYIKDDIQKNISYPSLARKMGWEGRVVVSFVVCETGMVVDIKIVESSGFALLDKNAVESIQKAVPFPSPPVKAELVIPITYRLGA